MAELLKQPRTFQQQLDLLQSRGMIIEDPGYALKALETINYYRISGYAFHFKKIGEENYIDGTNFSTVMKLYEFDTRFRNILFPYLEIIEIAVRTQVAYYFSHEYGSYGHYGCWNFRSDSFYAQFEQAMSDAIQKNRDVAFIAHHIKKYSTPSCINIPLWALVEILSFSTISKFYQNIHYSVQKKIALSLKSDPAYLGNQLHCLANLRNICAHYGRLYNRVLNPKIAFSNAIYSSFRAFSHGADLSTDHVYGYLIGIQKLLPDARDFEKLIHEVKSLLEEYQGVVELSLIGFPEKWDEFLNQL